MYNIWFLHLVAKLITSALNSVIAADLWGFMDKKRDESLEAYDRKMERIAISNHHWSLIMSNRGILVVLSSARVRL